LGIGNIQKWRFGMSTEKFILPLSKEILQFEGYPGGIISAMRIKGHVAIFVNDSKVVDLKIWTVAKLAKLLGLLESQVKRLRNENKIPAPDFERYCVTRNLSNGEEYKGRSWLGWYLYKIVELRYLPEIVKLRNANKAKLKVSPSKLSEVDPYLVEDDTTEAK
jgi:hypothetical protein